MVFSSFTFLFIFLPVLLVLYFAASPKYRNILLLFASILFYGFSDLGCLYLLFAIVIINFLSGILISEFKNFKKFLFILTLLINVGALLYFKYFNFVFNTYLDITHTNMHFSKVLLPLGISFYIFQALSYLIDVYNNKIAPQKNIYKFALYICFFPQLVAGPIIKYRDIQAQLESKFRENNFDNLCIGAKRFIIGLSKKVLIANNIGLIADKIFVQSPDMFPVSVAWLGAIAYTLQIFFDFSGYSDMAIGLGRIFGFKFMENFNYPFISRSITEFWSRWHISLYTWFRDYVYISLGGNRCGFARTLFNLLFVFTLTGIWHGANWTFLIWGIWHGVFIVFERIISTKNYASKINFGFVKFMQHVYLLLVVVLGFVIFRSENLNYAFKYLQNMFGFLTLNPDKFAYNIYYYIDSMDILILGAAILISTPLFKNMIYVKGHLKKSFINIWLIMLFILSVVFIAINSYNPFIYFRF